MYFINSSVFQRPQIAIALRALAIWLALQKFIYANVSQIALEIMSLP